MRLCRNCQLESWLRIKFLQLLQIKKVQRRIRKFFCTLRERMCRQIIAMNHQYETGFCNRETTFFLYSRSLMSQNNESLCEQIVTLADDIKLSRTWKNFISRNENFYGNLKIKICFFQKFKIFELITLCLLPKNRRFSDC